MDVNLSSAIHTAISSTQRIAHLMEQSTANVSTGQQQEADAQAKDIAAGLSSQTTGFLGVKDSIEQGQQSIQTATMGLQSAAEMLNRMKAVAQLYEDSNSATEQAALSAQFDELKAQLDGLVGDSSYGGTNLINASPDTLEVPLNEDGS